MFYEQEMTMTAATTTGGVYDTRVVTGDALECKDGTRQNIDISTPITDTI